MKNILTILEAIAISVFHVSASARQVRPVVVLAHGAFGDGSSWNAVSKARAHDGFVCVAAALPLRGLHSDTEYINDLLKSPPSQNRRGYSIGGTFPPGSTGDRDKNIPPAVHSLMAYRANAQETVVVKGASLVLMVSHPLQVTQIIEKAANSA